MYIYTCVYVYIYICIFTCVYIGMYIYIYVHRGEDTRICAFYRLGIRGIEIRV